uniref:Uncharacterized protein n=1 Tax=Anguilla anguilla TaxID=7936 RepID=A0A0E9VDZ2_ANGAN
MSASGADLLLAWLFFFTDGVLARLRIAVCDLCLPSPQSIFWLILSSPDYGG